MDDFFSDDPFEDIFEEFFGKRRGIRREHFIRGEEEERVIDFLEDEKNIYLVFELPGYEEEDVFVNVKGKTIEISVEKKNLEGVKEYLARKLSEGIRYIRNLPAGVDGKNFNHSLKNGILEIKFNKK